MKYQFATNNFVSDNPHIVINSDGFSINDYGYVPGATTYLLMTPVPEFGDDTLIDFTIVNSDNPTDFTQVVLFSLAHSDTPTQIPGSINPLYQQDNAYALLSRNTAGNLEIELTSTENYSLNRTVLDTGVPWIGTHKLKFMHYYHKLNHHQYFKVVGFTGGVTYSKEYQVEGHRFNRLFWFTQISGHTGSGTMHTRVYPYFIVNYGLTYDHNATILQNFFSFINKNSTRVLYIGNVTIGTPVANTSGVGKNTTITLTGKPNSDLTGSIDITIDRILMADLFNKSSVGDIITLASGLDAHDILLAFNSQFGVLLTANDLLPIDPDQNVNGGTMTFTAAPTNPLFAGTLNVTVAR